MTRDIDIAILSVRLSVRDVPVLDENSLTYCHSFFSPYGSPIIIVYQHQTSSQNSDGVTPCGGAKYRWGIKILRFSTNKMIKDSAIVAMKGEQELKRSKGQKGQGDYSAHKSSIISR